MGQSSSQMVASQAPTQDVPVISQPSTQIPALDGTQDEEPQTLKRVASSMDPAVEDTIKKAKRPRTKDVSRAGRKSMPQHMRGFAIQPSQEDIPGTQEEVRADVGASEEVVQADAGIGDVEDEIAVSQPAEPVVNGAGKRKKTERQKRRLPWQEETKEPETGKEDLEPEAPGAFNVITTGSNNPSPAKLQKRKRKDLELERLQRDAEDFAPELQSTPKPKPAVKRPKQAKDVDMPETVEEQPEPEPENGDDAVAKPAKPQKRSKAAKDQAQDEPDANASRANAKPSRKPAKAVTKPANAGAAATTSTKTSRSKPQDRLTAAEIGASPEADDEEAVADAEDAPVADSIPTPPESPDVPVEGQQDGQGEGQADAVNGNGTSASLVPDGKLSKSKKQNKRKRAAEATDDDEVEQSDQSPEDEAAGGNVKANGKPKVRSGKMATKTNDDDSNENDEYHEDDRDEDANASESDVSNKKATFKEGGKSKKQKPSNGVEEITTKERGQVQGTWSKDERALADETFEDVVRITAVPAWELKANIIDWKNPTPHLQQLKDALYEAFPKRDFKSIMRFCQRRYNAFDRGKWTDEQDQLLREAYELFPDQWTDISDHVGRFWEDCRGRWRGVLSGPEGTAETGPWSREEELRLAKVVQECRELVVKETEDPEAREDPEKADALISWKVVADKMDNTRNAKRCREKWKKIKDQDLSATHAPDTTQPIKSGTSGKQPKRLREAEKHYQQCETGDVYDIICEICSAIPDTASNFDHETTFWSIVATRNAGSKFSSSLRRLAFANASDDYSCKAVKKAETLAAKAKSVKEGMERMERKGEIEFGRVYEGKAKKQPVKKGNKVVAEGGDASEGDKAPAKKKAKSKKTSMEKAVGDGEDSPQKPAKKKKKQPSQKPKATKPKESKAFKSADTIVESDDEAVAEEPNDDGVQVEQTPAKRSADAEIDDDEEDAEPPARQGTEERSLGSRDHRLSPSTFVELCKGGPRAGKKGKGTAGERVQGRKRKERRG